MDTFKVNKTKWQILAGIIVVGIALDQVTKKIAAATLKGQPMQSFFGDTFRLDYAENTGAFLSLASTLPEFWRFLLLTVFTGIILAGLTVYIVVNLEKLVMHDVLAYSLLLSGGISNLIDRILYGRVIDFLNMGILNLRTGIFNIADMAIMASLFIIIYFHWIKKQPESDKNSDDKVTTRKQSAT